MKKMTKKLSLDRQTIRNLSQDDLIGAQGGRIPLTRSQCAGECAPGTTTDGTTGPNTGANHCINTEFTCFAC